MRRPAALALALLLGACASAPPRVAARPDPATLPVCGFVDPTIPDPCRWEVRPGEWLVVRNAHPETPTRRHGWLWWAFLAVVL